MDETVIVVAAIAALAVLLIAVGLASSGTGAAINARIEKYGRRKVRGSASGQPGGADDSPGSESMAALDRVVESREFGANLARDLARADLRLRVSEYLFLWAITIVGLPAGFLLASFAIASLRSPVALLGAVLLGILVPRFWLLRRKARRLAAFNKQLPDIIVLIANALRSGSSLLQAVELVVREARPPISEEFSRVIREVNLGLGLEEALDNMVRRVESDDLGLMATAITIQYGVGGNLAEILDTISFTIRERVRIRGEIRALTAQQRLSGYVVGGLPFALVAILLVIAPGYLTPMFRNPPAILGYPAGAVALAAGAVMMATGFILIRRIVDIKV